MIIEFRETAEATGYLISNKTRRFHKKLQKLIQQQLQISMMKKYLKEVLYN